MDPIINPYSPGAGSKPPELAGRDKILSQSKIAIKRVQSGRSAKGHMLLGLRGVGKTVLLNAIELIAEENQTITISLEIYENRRLADQLVPHLRRALYSLSRWESTKNQVSKAFQMLAEFSSVFKISVGGVEMETDLDAIREFTGDIEIDLPELIVEIGKIANQAEKAIIMFIDEVQYLSEKDLSALIVSLHKINQKGYPLLLFGAGLPQLAGLAGDAKSYAERLFEFQAIGPLERDDAIAALVQPAGLEGVEYSEDALEHIVSETHGYPYFLQEWGKHAWDVADESPIDLQDARKATTSAIEQLDRGFFKVRLSRLTPKEKEYMRTMAELGPGPHRSGDIADLIGVKVTAVAPVRGSLIKKGMIYSPSHGDTAFTVPLYDQYLKRAMPAE